MCVCSAVLLGRAFSPPHLPPRRVCSRGRSAGRLQPGGLDQRGARGHRQPGRLPVCVAHGRHHAAAHQAAQGKRRGLYLEEGNRVFGAWRCMPAWVPAWHCCLDPPTLVPSPSPQLAQAGRRRGARGGQGRCGRRHLFRRPGECKCRAEWLMHECLTHSQECVSLRRRRGACQASDHLLRLAPSSTGGRPGHPAGAARGARCQE